MSMTGGDRWRLEKLQALRRQFGGIEVPAVIQSELDHLSGQLIAATQHANRIMAMAASALSLLLDIYDSIKKIPAADDG